MAAAFSEVSVVVACVTGDTVGKMMEPEVRWFTEGPHDVQQTKLWI
jgi:hypothetical protein